MLFQSAAAARPRRCFAAASISLKPESSRTALKSGSASACQIQVVLVTWSKKGYSIFSASSESPNRVNMLHAQL